MSTNKILKKENIMPVAVLVIIALVVALLLAAVNLFTAPEIERQKQEKIDAAFNDVLPEGSNFKEMTLTDEYPKEIKAAHKADGGYVFQIDTKGKEPMTLMVGVDDEGKISGFKVITENESPEYMNNVLAHVGDKYTGQNSETFGSLGEVGKLSDDIKLSSATLTSTGIYSAIKAALDGYTVANGGTVNAPEETLPKTDAEIIALAETLLGVNAGTLTDVTPDDGITDVKRVYRSADKKSYAVYTVVMSQYGTVETETLAHIDASGTIKDLNKLTWKTSDAMYGYVPPTQEEADRFYDRLVGANSDTIGSVDAVTNATNTSGNLKNALTEAMTVVKDIVKADMPTAEETIIAKAEALLGVSSGALTDVTPPELTNVKRVYRSANKKNYAVYTVVMSQYGTPETETLVHIDASGVIKGIEKIRWKTSDAMYGYVPPTQEQADAFYERLVGATSATIDSVDAVTNATNTSGNLVAALKEALETVKTLVWKDTPTPESEIIADAAALAKTQADLLTDVTPEGAEFVKRVYRDDENGYIVYTVVINEDYGRVETEALIYIDFYGRIKAAKKLTWKTSDAMYGYVPPTQEQADAFFESLVGETADTLDSLAPVTNATNTTGSLKKAVSEALSVVDGLDFEPAPSPAWRIIGITVTVLSVLAIAAYIAVPKIMNRRRNYEK